MSDNQLYRDMDMVFGWCRPVIRFCKKAGYAFMKMMRSKKGLVVSMPPVLLVIMVVAYILAIVMGIIMLIQGRIK